MNENCIFKNIEIAKKYLEQFNLLLPNDKMCMECCYFPPFSEKTFYVQVFCENNQYKAHCAYTYYADFWGTNTLEFCGITSVPGDQDFSEFGGGSDSGPWLLTNVENLGGFQGFEPSTQRVSESVAWPGAASSTIQYDIDADFVRTSKNSKL